MPISDKCNCHHQIDTTDFQEYTVVIPNVRFKRVIALQYPETRGMSQKDQEGYLDRSIFRSDPLIVNDEYDFRLYVHLNCNNESIGVFLATLNEDDIKLEFHIECLNWHCNTIFHSVIQNTFTPIKYDFGFCNFITHFDPMPDTLEFKVYIKVIDIESLE